MSYGKKEKPKWLLGVCEAAAGAFWWKFWGQRGGCSTLLTTSAYINQNCSKKVAIFQLAHSIFSPVCSHLLLRCSRRVRSCGLRILAPCLYKMTWACHILFAVMSCDTKKHKFNFVAVDYYSASSSSSHNHILNLLLPTLMTQISFITLPSLSQQES